VAGDEMDQDVIQYARNKYNLLIGERMAESVKISIGSAHPLWEEKTATLRGRNLVTGLPEAVEVSSIEVREALSSSVNTIVAAIKDAIDETPPEIIADLMESGVCMAGGASQLQGLVERLQEELRIRVWLAEDPMTCVARGAGRILEEYDTLKRLLVGLERGSTQHG
jgi:rod shape-determining protein MreB